MEKVFSSFPVSTPKIDHTTCDVIDEGKQFRIKMDIPGIKKNKIKLDVTENSLQVFGEHKEESEEKKKNYLRKERSQVSYHRTLSLSEKITTSQVKAKLIDGILEIILPKSKPTNLQQKKSISVQ